MPELPEVETVRRGIAGHVTGRTVTAVTVRQPQLRWPVPADLAQHLIGQRITAVGRRAKYLLLDIGRQRLLIHLGMSGRLFLLRSPPPPGRHDHLDLQLSGGLLLRFHDPRRFGSVSICDAADIHPLLLNLGPEPLDPGFDGDYLFAVSRGRKATVKSLLMDGRVVVGVGNIYASESLFAAGIRPGRAAGRVGRADYGRLASAIREVLLAAIAQGGTTLTDSSFAAADGSFGYFQQRLAVYDREGQSCLRCGDTIRRSVIAQRSSFYCPGCQR